MYKIRTMDKIRISYLENKIKELEEQLEQYKNIMYDFRNGHKEIKDAKHEVYCTYLELDHTKTRLIECLKEQINNNK